MIKSRGLLVIALAALVVAATAQSMDFALMIDAGSTGSRIHIFQWKTRVFQQLPPPLTVPIEVVGGSQRLTPGISTGATGLAQLKTLIAFAKTQLAAHRSKFSSIPIYLKATAGMRVLPFAQRESIMTDVRNYLATTGFMFKPKWASVISGEQEGVFGWISVNYAAGRLTGGQPTLGALDLGGASTQITFQANCDILANLFNVQLEQVVDVNVYTHSFLYFGQNEAARRVAQAQVDAGNVVLEAGAADAMPTFMNPCLNTGYSTTFTTIRNRTVAMQGSGDYAKCQAAAAGLMYKQAPCLTDAGGNFTAQPSTCSINGVYQPPLYGEFMSFSGFAHVQDFYDLPLNASLAMLRQKAQLECGLTWAQLQAAHPGVPAQYLQTYCGTAAYIDALLGDGYGFSQDSRMVTVDADASYALGSMIFEANLLQWQYQGPVVDTSKEPFIGLFIAFLILFVVASAMLVYSCRTTATVTKALQGAYDRGAYNPLLQAGNDDV